MKKAANIEARFSSSGPVSNHQSATAPELKAESSPVELESNNKIANALALKADPSPLELVSNNPAANVLDLRAESGPLELVSNDRAANAPERSNLIDRSGLEVAFDQAPETFYGGPLPEVVPGSSPIDGGITNGNATADTSRIEAPVTLKAYLMCAFSAFGGILIGYNYGYIWGILTMSYFVEHIDPSPKHIGGNHSGYLMLSSRVRSLIVYIPSAGTFFGAIIAGDLADFIGRRTTIIAGCFILIVGVILQIISTGLAPFVFGRFVAGFGVGFVTTIIILYMSEVSPKRVRGATVAGYQFFVTLGILLASCVDDATKNRDDSGSYRIPTSVQMLWALILGTGLFFLPESPRYFVGWGKLDKATKALSRLRGEPEGSEYIQQELAEIWANHEYELRFIAQGSYISSWSNCFSGSLFNPSSNLRRTILGTSLQMMQQWTGVNFVFYFGTAFFIELGTNSNLFLIGLITTLVCLASTPISFWSVERIGRRPLLVWGALGMAICQFIVAICGVTPVGKETVRAEIAFIYIYIFLFSTSWGPGAWIVVGEIFPLPIRSRGVGLSIASNSLWNCLIGVIAPYMVGEDLIGVIAPYMIGEDKGGLGTNVLWVWGSLCSICFVYAYFLVPETKGLSLEQVDRMMEETTPRNSSKWKPTTTYAAEMGPSVISSSLNVWA